MQEMCGGWRPPQDQQIECDDFPAAESSHRAHELEVFEKHVRVATGGEQLRSTHRECSRPVATTHPREQRSGGIETRVPGEWREEVLWSYDFRVLEQRGDLSELGRLPADVIVSNHHLVVASMGETRSHVAHFPHQGVMLGRHDPYVRTEQRMMTPYLVA